MKVLLIQMPFGAVERPALGISLLKAGLEMRDHDCQIRYLNLDFAAFIGLDLYNWIVDDIPYTSFAGDWCFTLPLYGRRPDVDWGYVKEILVDTWQRPQDQLEQLVWVREQTPAFIDACLLQIDWQRYDVVGFTSTFVQNIAALSLAKAIKTRFPKISVVFGGANWEDEMGVELHQRFPFVDYVCQGEADQSFPALIDALENGNELNLIPGILYRNGDQTAAQTAQARPVENVDNLPIPDFTDYYDALAIDPRLHAVSPTLLMETSRGCWWGAKNHCTFCGLNGNGIGFRSKSAQRALMELEYLSKTWDPLLIIMVDNILDMAYFHAFLPALAKKGDGRTPLFYETKSNLKREQVRLLREAGIHNIQPGIESLSDNILRLMRKGTTGLRNIQLLKWCHEYGVSVDWNLLYGFPGEAASDYQEIADLLPSIWHLMPPSACGPLRLDRFSPYHQCPEQFGLKNIRPLSVYRYLYPFDESVLMRIACYFDFDYEEGRYTHTFASEILPMIERWSSEG
ncbi:MAG: RiPP maturation radical SAM C-methyltransferase, partial [Gammaproteobacteria bacterium]